MRYIDPVQLRLHQRPDLHVFAAQGVSLILGDSSPVLLVYMPGLSAREVQAICQDRCWFGVYEEEGVLFFLYRFGKAFSWSYTAYHRRLEEQRRPVRLSLISESSRALLQVIVTGSEDGVVQGWRMVGLSPAVTQTLWQSVLMQDGLPDDYAQRIETVAVGRGVLEMVKQGVICQGQ
jgi:hypothetical protein